MGHIERASNVVEQRKKDVKVVQDAFNRTPKSGGRFNILGRQSAELAGRVRDAQTDLDNAEKALAAARLMPDEIIIQEEPISDLPVQEQLILQVPIQERIEFITPLNGEQDNTLRNVLLIGGAILLLA